MTGPDLAGKQLGRYKIVEKIAAGGMGVVYRAHDERLQRDVALKVLPEGTLADDDSRRRFHTEALTLSKFNHPNIAVIHDFNTVDGVDFLVMELVEGDSLSSRIGAGPLPERDVLKIGIQIAEAVEGAHEQGIIHRDLKPDNVMLTTKSQVKVLDFGLARWHLPTGPDLATAAMTQPHAVVGTLPYMSPEQLRAEAVDVRSDVYALGAILYEMATGKRAFPERGQADLTDAVLNRTPITPRVVNPGVAPELETIVLKCLEKDPDLRYQSAKEVAVDLRRIGGTSTTHSEIRVPVAKPSRSWKKPALIAAAAAFIAAALTPFITDRLSGPDDSASDPDAANANVVVVLPFENLGSPEDDYFADGITEEITSRLAQIGGLKVISRTSAVHYAGTGMSLQEIGAELGVGTILEGTIRTDRSPDGTGTVRVTPQLIRVADDTHLWADRYTVDLVPGKIFEVQAEIAEQVASALDVTLLQSEQDAIHRQPTDDLEAYNAYLLGRFYWNKRTARDLETAAGYFRKSVDRDPNLARGYAGLADTYQLFGTYSVGSIPYREALELAEVAALRAIELDSTLAEAYASLAAVQLNKNWDFPGAERNFRKALALDPQYAVAHYWYAELMFYTMRFEYALNLTRKAVSLDPGSAVAHHLLAGSLGELGRIEESIASSKKALELAPDFIIPHVNLANIYLDLGRYDEFEREFTLFGYPQAGRLIALVAKDSLSTESALAQLDELAEATPYSLSGALFRAYFKDTDTVLELLRRAVEEREDPILLLRVFPSLRYLHSDPRFIDIVEQMGLDYEPQSWP